MKDEKTADLRWIADSLRMASVRKTEQRLLSESPGFCEQVAAIDADAAALNTELRQAGIPFSIIELVNVRAPYPEAIPILVAHLKLKHLPKVEESIVRSLGVPYAGIEARNALLELLRLRRATVDRNQLFVIGNALAEIDGNQHSEALVKVAQDFENREAMVMPLHNLARARPDIVGKVAEEMLDRDPWAVLAFELLRKARLRLPHVREKAQAVAETETGELRAEARRYLRWYDSATI
jgi:hypothetical protein